MYSVDHDAIVAVPLLKVGHTSVTQHRVVRVALEDGRVLQISPGHPTADGRTFGDLLAGGQLDAEHAVRSAESFPTATMPPTTSFRHRALDRTMPPAP